MPTFENTRNKSKTVYIRIEPELERDYQALRSIYPGKRSDIMRFALQQFADEHRDRIEKVAARVQ